MNLLNLMKCIRNFSALFKRNAPSQLAVSGLPEAGWRTIRIVGMNQFFDNAEQVRRVAIESNGDASQDILGDGLCIHHFLSNVDVDASADEKPPTKKTDV